MRTPTTGNLRALITSEDLIGTSTHFWKGRTMPHDQDDCAACKSLMPWRWHAWLGALTSRDHTHILFEMTKQVAQRFVLYRKQHGTLRGALMDAHRPSRRPNGRVAVQIKPFETLTIELPPAPDVVQCLSIIWNIALPSIEPGARIDDIPMVSVADESQPLLHTGNGNGRLS